MKKQWCVEINYQCYNVWPPKSYDRWNRIKNSIGSADYANGYLQGMIDLGSSPNELRLAMVIIPRKNKKLPEKAKKVVK